MSFFPVIGGPTNIGMASSVNSVRFPQSPATRTVKPTIYARPSGSDETGNGTLSNPYATPQRCALDIPLDLGLDSYFVDCTGVSVNYTLWELPAWRSERAQLFNFTPQLPELLVEGSVNFFATPTILETIASPINVIDPATGLLTISDPSKTWTVDQFKGLPVWGAGLLQGGIVVSNTANTLEISAPTSSGWTGPVTVRQRTAEMRLVAGGFPNGFRAKGVKAHVQFVGFNFVNVNNSPSAHVLEGSQIEFLSCAVDSLSHVGSPADLGQIHYANHFTNSSSGLSCSPPVVGSVQNSFFDETACVPPNSPSSYFMRGCVIDGADVASGNVGVDASDNLCSAFIDATLVRNCSSDGFQFSGAGNNRIRSCKSDGNTGSGLRARQGVTVRVTSLSGGGNGQFGVAAEDGSHVNIENPGVPNTGVSVTGTVDDLKVGSSSPRTYVDYTTNAPINNETDADQFARIWS